MSDEDTGADPQARTNETLLRLRSGPLAAPVLSRVVTMVLTRAAWPIDRLNDAMLVCDALSAHAPAYAMDGHVTFAVCASGAEVEVRVEDLRAEGAAAIVRDAMLPGVGNVLETVPTQLSAEPCDGGSRLVLVLNRG